MPLRNNILNNADARDGFIRGVIALNLERYSERLMSTVIDLWCVTTGDGAGLR
jgi:hypothetical protein